MTAWRGSTAIGGVGSVLYREKPVRFFGQAFLVIGGAVLWRSCDSWGSLDLYTNCFIFSVYGLFRTIRCFHSLIGTDAYIIRLLFL